MLAAAVYLLCASTSLLCAVLLARGFTRTRARLLLWSSLCFAFLTLNNMLLFIDFVILPDVSNLMGLSFGIWRSLLALTGLGLLAFGLIWDTE